MLPPYYHGRISMSIGFSHIFVKKRKYPDFSECFPLNGVFCVFLYLALPLYHIPVPNATPITRKGIPRRICPHPFLQRSRIMSYGITDLTDGIRTRNCLPSRVSIPSGINTIRQTHHAFSGCRQNPKVVYNTDKYLYCLLASLYYHHHHLPSIPSIP